MAVSNNFKTLFTEAVVSKENSYNGGVSPNIAFIGEYVDCLNYNEVGVLLLSTQNGTLYFDHSIDGISAIRTADFFIAGGTNADWYAIAPKGKYVRIRFVADASGSLTLFTILNPAVKGFSFLPLSSIQKEDSIALTTKSVIAGKDLNGIFQNVPVANDGLLMVSAKPYTYGISEGDIPEHQAWSKIGFNGSLVAATEADLWSKGGVYTFPTAPIQMQAVSSSAGDEDTGTVIFSGTSTGGSTTTLIDTGQNFLGGTAVQVGDCIILDKSGLTPEWGYVSAVAATTLTVAGGFSKSGTGSKRAYSVIDKNTAGKTGAQAVKIDYLDGDYAEKTELIILDGNAPVVTVNTDLFRINSFRVIAAGSGAKPVGSLTLEATAGTDYSFITAGFTRARNAQYTVPAGKTLYVTNFSCGYAYAANQTYYGRIYTKANREISTGFLTGSIFYPFTEVLASNSYSEINIPVATRLPAKTDIKVSTVVGFVGAVTVVLRGWLELVEFSTKTFKDFKTNKTVCGNVIA